MDKAQLEAANVISNRVIDRHFTGRSGVVVVNALAMIIAKWAKTMGGEEYVDDLSRKAKAYLRAMK